MRQKIPSSATQGQNPSFMVKQNLAEIWKRTLEAQALLFSAFNLPYIHTHKSFTYKNDVYTMQNVSHNNVVDVRLCCRRRHKKLHTSIACLSNIISVKQSLLGLHFADSNYSLTDCGIC